MTNIPIERLTTSTLIYVETLFSQGQHIPCADFGEVHEIHDDGEGFVLTLEFRQGQFDHHYVEYGGTVEYGGRGEPRLKPIAVTPFDILSLAETRRRDPDLALSMACAAGADWDAIIPYPDAGPALASHGAAK